MTPSEERGSIEEICEILAKRREQLIVVRGSDHESQPFEVAFDPRDVNYEEMTRILGNVRERFPQWQIKGVWKQK